MALEGLAASIGSVGDAYDNAAAETVMGLYKNEAIKKGSPFWTGPLKTIADVEETTFDWVNWYNNDRLHSYLSTIPPEEYEQNYYARLIGSSPGARRAVALQCSSRTARTVDAILKASCGGHRGLRDSMSSMIR